MILLLLAALLAPAAPAAAQEVVAVLSSDIQAYREAYAGFQEAYGRPVPVLPLEGGRVRLPREVKAVVAFGSKAALAAYPERVALIVCMAPASFVSRLNHAGATVRVRMLPPSAAIVAGLREVQPGLRRLAVLWTAESAAAYREPLETAASSAGVTVVSLPVEDVEDLPEALRKSLGKADALWLPPDPALANPKSFATIREFSAANAMPFYVPTQGLVEAGAVAAVSASSREIGRTAAAGATAAVSGQPVKRVLVPEHSELSVNLPAAARAGLKVPEAALVKADKVYR